MRIPLVVCVTCLGAASLGLSLAADGQARTTSQQRIRVMKESKGEVVRRDSAAIADSIRADSIARAEEARRRAEQMRADSIARVEQMRRDSIAAVERARADSIAAVEAARAAAEKARADSIAAVEAARRAEQLRLEQLRNRYLFNQSGWYMGLAAGSAMPQDDFDEVGYSSGWNITVPIGFQRLDKPLGVRLDLGYSEFSGGTFNPGGLVRSSIPNTDPSVFSAELDLTFRFGLGRSKTTGFYLLGGGGYYHWSDVGFQSGLAGIMGEDPTGGGDFDNDLNKFGWNAGAGLEFGVGLAAIFLESRFVNVIGKDDDDFTNFYGTRSNNVQWVPIILGVKFY